MAKSQRASKEISSVQPRARRLMREALIYWRRYEKVEREQRKKAEREATEQNRLNQEMMEVCVCCVCVCTLSHPVWDHCRVLGRIYIKHIFLVRQPSNKFKTLARLL